MQWVYVRKLRKPEELGNALLLRPQAQYHEWAQHLRIASVGSNRSSHLTDELYGRFARRSHRLFWSVDERLTDKTHGEEYFRAMAIIERGEMHGHYQCER